MKNYYDRKLERIRARNIGGGFCLWLLKHLDAERDHLRAVDADAMRRTAEQLQKLHDLIIEMEDELERGVLYLAELKDCNNYLAARVRNLEGRLQDVTRKTDDLLRLTASNFENFSIAENEHEPKK